MTSLDSTGNSWLSDIETFTQSRVTVIARYLKTAIIRFLQLNPKANFTKTLKEAIKGYNSKFNKKIGGRPAELNSDYFGKVHLCKLLTINSAIILYLDPILREHLFKTFPKIQPFDEFYHDHILRQKKSKEKRKGALKEPDNFRKKTNFKDFLCSSCFCSFIL